jgi:signal transduction histidine kinase
MDLIAVRGAEKEVELVYEMAGDVTRLRQVLINLLSNPSGAKSW